jgi:hypothetical protein
MRPKTGYARNGDIRVAYQVVGDGPIDLLMTPGYVSHLDLWWMLPETARFLERLASFSRLILYDKRGTGLSDPAPGLPAMEERMEDLHAVLDAVGSQHTALLGFSEGGARAGSRGRSRWNCPAPAICPGWDPDPCGRPHRRVRAARRRPGRHGGPPRLPDRGEGTGWRGAGLGISP